MKKKKNEKEKKMKKEKNEKNEKRKKMKKMKKEKNEKEKKMKKKKTKMELAELKAASKKAEEKARRLREELKVRFAKIKQDKETKLMSWILKEFGITNCCYITPWNITFCNEDKTKKFNVIFRPFDNRVIINHPHKIDETCNYDYQYIKNQFKPVTAFSPALYIKNCNIFMENNPDLFNNIKNVEIQKLQLFAKYKTYYHLFFNTNYLLCLTFLLCAKKIFPRDIAKLIAQKIF